MKDHTISFFITIHDFLATSINPMNTDEVAVSTFSPSPLSVLSASGEVLQTYDYTNSLLEETYLNNGWSLCSDVCYDNSEYTGWHRGYPDSMAKIDHKSLRFVPWDNSLPFFLADFEDELGKPLDVCPRSLLRKITKKLESYGFFPKAGCEFEWFNFKETSESLEVKNFSSIKPITSGMFGYSLLRSTENSDYFNDLMDFMGDFRIPLEGLHTETGPGVYEAAISASQALEAADRAVLFKAGSKEIAKKYGFIASFMARWSEALPGCSGHVHLSLEDRYGRNLFSDESSPYKMSKTFRHFLAGLIHGVPELLPLLAPTVNSYKRLVEGFWAPTRMNWGVDNRTCAFRVLNSSQAATRVEVRVPGSDVNPYLALSAILAAGYEGIENEMELKSSPISGNAYEDKMGEKLASNLFDATKRFESSEMAQRTLGENFVKHFAGTRHWEWRENQKAITDWELKRYFEII